ncbi:hypothetical protein NUW54_g4302 [Trametes sanguinea]|uniref:Uncharacterized protein n=1 Tax=Trametes sanguinea TaxID=158606 RepID=A0ACC1Q067_9APHY|nr:hypothetical protein NUW54_g4302 [Trametes sanguinea]
MSDARDAGEHLSLDSHRAQYFEKQSKAQATRIIDLEAKIAYLETKVEHLEGCLERERALQHSEMAARQHVSGARHEQQDTLSASSDFAPARFSGHEVPSAPSQRSLKHAPSSEPPLFENLLSPAETSETGNLKKKAKLEKNVSLWSSFRTLAEVASHDCFPPAAHESSRAQTTQGTHPHGSGSVGFSKSSTIETPNDAAITSRFSNIESLPIPHLPRHIRDFKVTRNDLTNDPWRVPPTQICQQSATGRNCMFVGLSVAPYAPRQPGKPGLLFTIGKVPDWDVDSLQTTFASVSSVTLENGKMPKSKHVYLGEYHVTRASPLSPAEFSVLAPKVKDQMVSYVMNFNEFASIRWRVVPAFCKSKGSRKLENTEVREAREMVMRAYEEGTEASATMSLSGDNGMRLTSNRLSENICVEHEVRGV